MDFDMYVLEQLARSRLEEARAQVARQTAVERALGRRREWPRWIARLVSQARRTVGVGAPDRMRRHSYGEPSGR